MREPRLPGDPPKTRRKRYQPPNIDSVLRLVAALIYLLASVF